MLSLGSWARRRSALDLFLRPRTSTWYVSQFGRRHRALAICRQLAYMRICDMVRRIACPSLDIADAHWSTCNTLQMIQRCKERYPLNLKSVGLLLRRGRIGTYFKFGSLSRLQVQLPGGARSEFRRPIPLPLALQHGTCKLHTIRSRVCLLLEPSSGHRRLHHRGTSPEHWYSNKRLCVRNWGISMVTHSVNSF